MKVLTMKILFLVLTICSLGLAQLRPSTSAGSSVRSSSTKITGNAQDSGCDITFVNPENAQAEDGTLTVTGGGVENGLPACITQNTFGFSIPSNAVVDSMYVQIKIKKGSVDATTLFSEIDIESNQMDQYSVDHSVPTTLGWRSFAFSTNDDADFFATFGNATSVNSNGFNCSVSINNDEAGANVISIDAIAMRIGYTVTTAGSSATLLGVKRPGISRN